MVSLLEQAQLYKTLSAKDKISASEQLKMTVCMQAMESNDIHTLADIDRLREKTENLNKKISALKENLEGCRQRYDVYSDIAKTYADISQGDYISKMVEEEKKRREQVVKKNKKKL